MAAEVATVLAGLGRDVTPFVLVLVPAVAAVLVTMIGGRADMRSLFGRMGRWRVGWPWYLGAVGIPVVEKLVVDVAGAVSSLVDLDLPADGQRAPGRVVDA